MEPHDGDVLAGLELTGGDAQPVEQAQDSSAAAAAAATTAAVKAVVRAAEAAAASVAWGDAAGAPAAAVAAGGGSGGQRVAPVIVSQSSLARSAAATYYADASPFGAPSGAAAARPPDPPAPARVAASGSRGSGIATDGDGDVAAYYGESAAHASSWSAPLGGRKRPRSESGGEAANGDGGVGAAVGHAGNAASGDGGGGGRGTRASSHPAGLGAAAATSAGGRAWPSNPAQLSPGDWAALDALGDDADALLAVLGAVLDDEPNTTSLQLAIAALGGGNGARALLREVAGVEAAGGLPVADGSRRRSPGGVFFTLLRDRVDGEAYKAVFAHKARAHNAGRNQRRRSDAALRAISLGHAPPAGWRPAPAGGGER